MSDLKNEIESPSIPSQDNVIRNNYIKGKIVVY